MATKLKRTREQQFLSVEFISEVIGISKEEYNALEQGHIELISKNQLKDLVDLLGVEIDDIKENRTNPKEIRGLARTYNKLTSKDRRELDRLMNFGSLIEKKVV
ncbi:helix-turn-helix transcriptional regulator [Lactococcus petauri]|uniref:helix-turn-helix transcriptional regulator n=1 Tax=Lactococcus petauri TaxID=1940789 RepID=UPI0031FE86C6